MMCLGIIYNEEKQKQIISKMKTDKDGYITLYKLVKITNGRYQPPFFNVIAKDNSVQYNNLSYFDKNENNIFFKNGENIANTTRKLLSFIVINNGSLRSTHYMSGFHIYKNRKDAASRTEFKESTHIPVKIKKEWITNIGEDQYTNGPVTFIVNKFIIPNYTKWDLFKIKLMNIIFD